eukprot:g1238.t1
MPGANAGELAAGIFLSFGGSTLANLGMVLQKRSHMIDAKRPKHQRRPYIKRKGWVFGFVVFVLGQAAIMSSFGFIDQATCAVLTSLALVSNAFFARCFFDEQLTRSDVIAIVTIIAGLALVVIFYEHPEQSYDASEIEHLLRAPGFICASLGLVALMFALFRARWQNRSSTLGLALMPSIIGAFSLTFSGVTMKLAKRSAEGHGGGLGPAWTILVAFLFIVMAVSNVHFLNEGLARCAALVLIPLYYNINNVLTVVLGIVLYQDFDTFEEPLNCCMFVVGVALCGVGVKVLAEKAEKGKSDDVDGRGGGMEAADAPISLELSSHLPAADYEKKYSPPHVPVPGTQLFQKAHPYEHERVQL